VIEDIYYHSGPSAAPASQVAREQGLQPLSNALLRKMPAEKTRTALAEIFVDPEKGVADIERGYAGARDIVAETIAETGGGAPGRARGHPPHRRGARPSKGRVGRRRGQIPLVPRVTARALTTLPPHRILAINRGERGGRG